MFPKDPLRRKMFIKMTRRNEFGGNAFEYKLTPAWKSDIKLEVFFKVPSCRDCSRTLQSGFMITDEKY